MEFEVLHDELELLINVHVPLHLALFELNLPLELLLFLLDSLAFVEHFPGYRREDSQGKERELPNLKMPLGVSIKMSFEFCTMEVSMLSSELQYCI